MALKRRRVKGLKVKGPRYLRPMLMMLRRPSTIFLKVGVFAMRVSGMSVKVLRSLP